MNYTEDIVIRIPEVQRRTGLSASDIIELCKKGQFPMYINLGQFLGVVWVEQEVDDFVARQINR